MPLSIVSCVSRSTVARVVYKAKPGGGGSVILPDVTNYVFYTKGTSSTVPTNDISQNLTIVSNSGWGGAPQMVYDLSRGYVFNFPGNTAGGTAYQLSCGLYVNLTTPTLTSRCVWMKITTAQGHICSSGATNSYFSSANIVSGRYGATTTTPYTIDSIWHHFVYTVDATTVSSTTCVSYIDGVLNQTRTANSTTSDSGQIGLGILTGSPGIRNGTAPNSLFDDWRIYNYVLTPAQVLTIYNATKNKIF